MQASDHAFVDDYLTESQRALRTFATEPEYRDTVHQATETIATALRAGGKLLIAGNGGSAADAQHLAAEFVGRMLYDRPSLAALALTTDTSALTAIGNDYGFETVFERQVAGLGRPGDVLIALSTSGRSPNILRALDAARARSVVRIGFTGADAGPMAAATDILLKAPSTLTPVVQQVHMVAGHLICALVERVLHPPD